MKTATHNQRTVLVICKSTKNTRIHEADQTPSGFVKKGESYLVPTSSLTFHEEPTKKSTATFQDVYEEFLTLATNLSPENLTCDGELSRSQIRARYNQLMTKWALLEAKIGMTVTEDMVWGSFNSRR